MYVKELSTNKLCKISNITIVITLFLLILCTSSLSIIPKMLLPRVRSENRRNWLGKAQRAKRQILRVYKRSVQKYRNR